LERAFAIQAALAAFPPPKAAPQASRLRLVTRSTSNPFRSPFQRACPNRSAFLVCDEEESPLKRAEKKDGPLSTSRKTAGLEPFGARPLKRPHSSPVNELAL
jgi:hypothetical protein